MFIKQYEINLPADYDIGHIRKRAEEKGSFFDTFPGLGLKCFLIREKGRFGASGGQYAPVYLWPREELMWSFLAGPAFAAIKDSFGTPPVSTWPGMAFACAPGLEKPRRIRSVERRMRSLSPEIDLMDLRRREQREAEQAVAENGALLARAVGLEPRNWNLVHFDFWSRTQVESPKGVESYEVLHVSAPDVNALTSL